MSASDVNRVFLQAVLSRQCMPLPLAHTLCKNAIQAVNSVNGSLNLVYSPGFYINLVDEVNRALEPLFLEFRQMMSEDDGQPVCAIINVKGDEVAQMATQYNPTEIAYFKLVVEQIMLAPNESYCVPSMVALREAGNLPTKSLTKAQAEALLTSFVANGWLMLSPEGRYTLSSRAVMELQPFLKSTYEDEVLECTSCMEIVTKGISCYTPNCKCRLHNHCYKLHMNTRQTCPSCQADWSAGVPRVKKVGEAAAERDDGRANQPRRQQRRSRQEGERDTPESEDELGSRRRSQSRGNGGGGDDDEEDEVSRSSDKKEKQKAAARKRSRTRASSSSQLTRRERGGGQVATSEAEAEMQLNQDDGDEDDDSEEVNPRRRSRHG